MWRLAFDNTPYDNMLCMLLSSSLLWMFFKHVETKAWEVKRRIGTDKFFCIVFCIVISIFLCIINYTVSTMWLLRPYWRRINLSLNSFQKRIQSLWMDNREFRYILEINPLIEKRMKLRAPASENRAGNYPGLCRIISASSTPSLFPHRPGETTPVLSLVRFSKRLLPHVLYRWNPFQERVNNHRSFNRHSLSIEIRG